MKKSHLDQAREIYATGRMIQARIASRYAEKGTDAQDERILELTFPQMNTLLTIRDRGKVTIKELSETLQVSAPSASTMVDRLVELGALTRVPNPTDRRGVVVRVSSLGERTADAMEHHVLDALVDLLRRLGPERAGAWCALYGGIREILLADKQAARFANEDSK